MLPSCSYYFQNLSYGVVLFLAQSTVDPLAKLHALRVGMAHRTDTAFAARLLHPPREVLMTLPKLVLFIGMH